LGGCLTSYKVEPCEGGIREVTWESVESTPDEYDSFEDEVAVAACYEKLGACSGGSEERACGEPIIKLPGFSLFAFFVSLFVIGIYYVVGAKDE
jgi:hypothetical protein